jgi:hypothetical protein
VATLAEGGLLDSAADLVDGFHPEGGDLEGVQHVDRPWQVGGELAPERVQRGDPDLLPPRDGPGRQPVHPSGIAGVPVRVRALPGMLIDPQPKLVLQAPVATKGHSPIADPDQRPCVVAYSRASVEITRAATREGTSR